MGDNVATKNTDRAIKDIPTTELALVSEQALSEWLADPQTYLTQKIKGKNGRQTERQVKRNLTLSATAPVTLYRAAVLAVSELPGGLTTNQYGQPDIASGFLTRQNRAAMWERYLPDFDYVTWEAAESERISSERSERMSSLAAERGISLEALRGKISLIDKLKDNPKLRALAEQDAELAELFDLLDTDA